MHGEDAMTGGLVYYITAHGFGHGVRSVDILRAFHARYPDVPLTVVTDLPASFLASRLRGIPHRVERRATDPGMIQHDAVRVDRAATAAALEDFCGRWDTLVREERAFLEIRRPALVTADIPALPIEAAAACGVPAVAAGNFSWDWIYRHLSQGDDLFRRAADRFAAAYRRAGLLLRMPLHGDMTVFPNVKDIPLVAAPGRDRRAEIARTCGADPARYWVVLSFSAMELAPEALGRVERLRGCDFLAVPPWRPRLANLHIVDQDRVPHIDLVASADAVLSKPGFGIVSECAVNARPLIYVDREDFAEYPVLEAGVRRHLRCAHLPAARFYAGDWAPAVEAVRRAPEPPARLPSGGAALAADRLARAGGWA